MTVPGDPATERRNGASNGTDNHVSTKPHLVWGAVPGEGHMAAQIWLAGEMVSRGYEVTFVGGADFAKQLARIGVKHHILPAYGSPTYWVDRCNLPEGFPRLLYDVQEFFIPGMVAGFKEYNKALEEIRAADPTREVIVLQEQFLMPTLPWHFGAPLPKGYEEFPRTININAVPMCLPSQDTGPFGTALPPDSTPSGRARNTLLHQLLTGPQGLFSPADATLRKAVEDLGATAIPDEPGSVSFISSPATTPGATLQLTVPSLEYPRSDLPPNIKFVGCPPRQPFDGWEPPSWWNEVTSARESGRKVVAVSQGTIATQYQELLVPTLEVLAEREGVLVVALLGSKGAMLDASVKVPANARVADYAPYDALLPFVDVWVMNGGYGAFQHGIVNGVPMVLAGVTEDKAEVSARGEWSGVGVNLRTSRPSKDALLAAIEEVMSNDKYKRRVLEIKAEADAIDAAGEVERQIVEFTVGK